MTTRIWMNSDGVQKVFDGAQLQQLEREVAERKLAEIQAQFVLDFGFEGSFAIESSPTPPMAPFGTSRTSFRILAADARTTATLNRHQGWLGKFTQ